MTKTHKRVKEETWEELLVRFVEMRADFQRMLDQLNGKRRPARFWKWERHLKKWLEPKLSFIDKIIKADRPVKPAGKEAMIFIQVLYELDESRPKIVDDFHRLMEAAGELYYAE